MKLDQFLHQGQAYPTAFVSPAASILDAMEAVKQARNFVSGNAHSGVTNPQFDTVFNPGQGDSDFALECEFEGIGDQVKNNLFPHAAVDKNRLVELGTIEHEPETGFFRG